MDAALIRLLDRAELCYERGQLKMADSILNEMAKRGAPNVNDSDFQQRFERLCDLVPEAEQERGEATDVTGREPCEQCDQTGLYRSYDKRSRKTCYACKGKGFIDPEDRARNERYWSYRRQTAQRRKEAQVGSF